MNSKFLLDVIHRYLSGIFPMMYLSMSIYVCPSSLAAAAIRWTCSVLSAAADGCLSIYSPKTPKKHKKIISVFCCLSINFQKKRLPNLQISVTFEGLGAFFLENLWRQQKTLIFFVRSGVWVFGGFWGNLWRHPMCVIEAQPNPKNLTLVHS